MNAALRYGLVSNLLLPALLLALGGVALWAELYRQRTTAATLRGSIAAETEGLKVDRELVRSLHRELRLQQELPDSNEHSEPTEVENKIRALRLVQRREQLKQDSSAQAQSELERVDAELECYTMSGMPLPSAAAPR